MLVLVGFPCRLARAGEALSLDRGKLADPDGTLAIYMGKAAAPEVAAGLIAAGLPADTPVALIENASLPNQRSFRTRLEFLPLAARTALTDGPALIVIGLACEATTSVTGENQLQSVANA